MITSKTNHFYIFLYYTLLDVNKLVINTLSTYICCTKALRPVLLRPLHVTSKHHKPKAQQQTLFHFNNKKITDFPIKFHHTKDTGQ